MKKYIFTFAIILLLSSLLHISYLSSFWDYDDVFYLTQITGEEIVVIDAGHGGEDGGAISVSGAIESHINLAIALKLDQLFGLYGVNSILLRDSDISLHDPDAQTLRQKKVSDLQNRVSLIQALDQPTVISIHQNTYTSSIYHGAQVFYAKAEASAEFAQTTQNKFKQVLDPGNQRVPAPAPESVYLMSHIECKAILVECGFLSNPTEDLLLQTPAYQMKIAAVLLSSYLESIDHNTEGGTTHASQK